MQEIKPNFECQEKERKFVSVNYTNNEALLYEKPVVLGLVFTVFPIKQFKKDGKILHLPKDSLQDNVPITYFENLVDYIEEETTFLLAMLKIDHIINSYV